MPKIISLKILIIFLGLMQACSSNYNNDLRVPIEIIEDRSIEHRVLNPQLVKEFEIRFLEIENCLFNSYCFRTDYTFNSCGKVEDYRPPMTPAWWHYEYDENCRLSLARAKNYVQYQYEYFENDSVKQSVYEIDQDTVKGLVGRYKFKKVFKKRKNALYTKDGDLQQVILDGLVFPCGVTFEGQHIKKYNYYENGLISSVEYRNTSDSVVVEKVYNYFRKDSLRIDFESLLRK